MRDTRLVHVAYNSETPFTVTVDAFCEANPTEADVIAHIERGEVVQLGGGASPDIYVWMGDEYASGPDAIAAFEVCMNGGAR